jgi:nitrogen fixation-related uncharacterized protein
MSGLLFFIGVLAVFSAIGMLALAYGVDTRPEFDDDRAPACGLSV